MLSLVETQHLDIPHLDILILPEQASGPEAQVAEAPESQGNLKKAGAPCISTHATAVHSIA